MGCSWSMFRSLSTWDWWFCIRNGQSGKFQGIWKVVRFMLGIYEFNVHGCCMMTCLSLVFVYWSETVRRMENERYRIRAVRMDCLRVGC